VIRLSQNWLDVDDRRSVDGLDRTDPQSRSLDRADDDGMKAEWIRPVWRFLALINTPAW
jgi:hypothetical protein